MNKNELTVRGVNIKIMILSFIIVLPLALLVAIISESFKNTVSQTYFIIFWLSIIAGANFLIIKNTTKLITFSFEDKLINITSKDKNLIKINYSDIKNYNIYYLIIKKMGYYLRIEADKNYSYWITWINFDKKQKIDDDNFYLFKEILGNKLNLSKKNTLIDKLILFIALLPWLIFIIGILALIGIFYYIFYCI